jgi:hypothetical protein
MSYFQNPFPAEFRGNWILGDRQHSLTFICPPNSGRSEELITTWNKPNNGFYDLSGNDSDENSKSILKIRMSINGSYHEWVNLEIDVTENTNAGLNPAPVASAITPNQIVSILNSNSNFSSYFIASVDSFDQVLNNKIVIKQKYPTCRMRYFVVNGGAEEVLGFNSRAGVAEMPSYFKRHKVWGGDMAYPTEGTNAIVELDPSNSGGSSNVDNNIIDNAVNNKGVSLRFSSESVRQDYELLEGRASGLFTFQKITVDGSDRITQIIEYPAGAKVGDFARKIMYSYTGSNSNPTTVMEVPIVLQNSDIINP